MIKKSENEMRAEETVLRGLAANETAPAEIQRQADMAGHALRWALDSDAGSPSASDLLSSQMRGGIGAEPAAPDTEPGYTEPPLKGGEEGAAAAASP